MSDSPSAKSDGVVTLGLRRLNSALVASSLAALGGGVLEARWVSSATGTPVPALDATGLLAAVALPTGLIFGGLAIFVHGARRADRSWFAPEEPTVRARRSAALVVVPSLAVAVVVVVSRLAFRLLVSELPSVAAGALAALVLGAVATAVVWIGAGVVEALAEVAAERLPGPALALVVGVIAALSIFFAGVATGTPNGEGGVLGILGVLRREELDLRGVGLLSCFAAAGYLGALSRRMARPWVGLLFAASALALMWRAADLTMEEGVAIERAAPLGRLPLARLRAASDADGDGYGRRFGGGDCRDDDPSIFPGADDVPGNGLDEDCSGEDDSVVVLDAPKPAPTPVDAAARMREQVPSDLGLILVTVDTLRHDLGFMGYERPVSPNIDALAGRSVVFERAYSLASYTGKSVGPLLIGKYPSETHRNWGHFNKFGKEDTFLRTRLARAGVFTMSVQGHWYFGPGPQGIGGGFDAQDTSASPRVPAAEGDTTVNAEAITDGAIRMLSEPRHIEGRFYLWVHYMEPHASYVPHPEFDFGAKGRDLYDGEVAFVDRQIGRLLDHVRKSALAARTAIILTSDHGEAFGEHGIMRHGRELWEEMVRVPLIVHVPGVAPRRHAERRSAIDLVPTVLDLFGIDAPAGEDADFVSGRSLLADVLMPEGHEPGQRIVFIDMAAGPYNDERQAFIEGDLKLHATAGRPLGLYDLSKDPEEKRDLLREDPETARRVLGRFKAFRRELREVRVKPR